MLKIAAVKFWNPKDHVFQFKTIELCPTIEEFSAILGYDPSKNSVAVSCDPRHRESLSDVLDLPTSITSSMVEGHMVNLRAVVSRLINKHTYGSSIHKIVSSKAKQKFSHKS